MLAIVRYAYLATWAEIRDLELRIHRYVLVVVRRLDRHTEVEAINNKVGRARKKEVEAINNKVGLSR